MSYAGFEIFDTFMHMSLFRLSASNAKTPSVSWCGSWPTRRKHLARSQHLPNAADLEQIAPAPRDLQSFGTCVRGGHSDMFQFERATCAPRKGTLVALGYPGETAGFRRQCLLQVRERGSAPKGGRHSTTFVDPQ